jgi:hypothetical protein
MAQTPTLKSRDGSVGAITNLAFVSWLASKIRFAIASRVLPRSLRQAAHSMSRRNTHELFQGGIGAQGITANQEGAL